MNEQERKRLIIFPIILLLALGFALAGSDQGKEAFGLPIFALAVGIAFIIQWIAFIPAYIFKTEKFYDLTGSITYLTVVLASFFLAENNDTRSLILTVIISIWAFRLGTFLFKRVLKSGGDSRFDDIKVSWVRFLTAWTIQGMWVSITAGAALAAITSSESVDISIIGYIGLVVWIFGFLFEVIADWQKSKFKADPSNKGDFIDVGLWSWSRHPNYFGEIVLWIGVAIIAFPVLQGWQYLTLISPIFVIFLLTKVSGIPLLEDSADERWGGQEDYENYKENTPVLIPRPPSS